MTGISVVGVTDTTENVTTVTRTGRRTRRAVGRRRRKKDGPL
jgi:hypothetical protein